MPLPHLNILQEKNSLLFQFILSEFIASYKEVAAIHLLTNKIKHSSDRKLVPVLKTSLTKLSGSTRSYMRIFAWSSDEGILSRLKNYCSFFSQIDGKTRKNQLEMHRNINRAWLHCLQSLDMMCVLEEGAISDDISLQKTLNKIINYMQRFSRSIAKVMQEFHDDENVVFFMLRHQPQLDELFGQQFVFKMLCRMYPKGLQGASAFLCKKYKKRGFDNLIPIIHARILELKAC